MAEKTEFVVDASIVAKWFLIESGSREAILLRDDFATGRVKLTVPTLMFYEVVNALRFSGVFEEGALVDAAKSLSKYRFGIWRPRGKLLELSAELSVEREMTVYDACYVALASRIGSKVITSDRELLSKFPDRTIRMSEYRGPPG